MSRNFEDWQLFIGPLGIVEGRELSDGCWELIDRGTATHKVDSSHFDLHYTHYDPFVDVEA